MRKISALLLIAMLASLAACGSDTASSDTTASSADTTAPAETEPLDALEARKLVDDELPAKDFGGREFLILGENERKNDMTVDETTGDVVLDAVYNRNRAVEERFNIKLTYHFAAKYQDMVTDIKASVNSGDDEYQLVSGHVVGLGAVAMDDYLLNWCDLDYINFEKPWWQASTLEDLTYNDRCYMAVGNYALSSIYACYSIYFNKRLAEEYKIPDPYTTVLEGKWTIDHLISLTKDVYIDMNGNNQDDETDFYGFITSAGSHANAFLWGFDERVISQDKTEGLKVTYKDGNITDIVEKLVGMIEDYPGITHCGVTGSSFTYFTGSSQQSNIFKNGQAIFTTSGLRSALSSYRDMKDDFGILPYPKWDENQTEYRAMADGAHSALCAPITVQDTECMAIITEALNAESYKQVVPAFYDVALKVKGARDETSVEIIDMITRGCVFDMGYVYDAWEGASFILERLVKTGNTNFESYWAGQSSSILARYEKVIKYFKGE